MCDRFVKHLDKKSFLRFVKHPEYLKEGQRLVFREGRTKAVGNVNKVTKILDWEGLKWGRNVNKVTNIQIFARMP